MAIGITYRHKVQLAKMNGGQYYFGEMEGKSPMGTGLFMVKDGSFCMYESISANMKGSGMSLRYSATGSHSLGFSKDDIPYGPQMIFRHKDPITCCYIGENGVADGFNLVINNDGTFEIFQKDALGNRLYRSVILDDDNSLAFKDIRRLKDKTKVAYKLDKTYRMFYYEMRCDPFEQDKGIIPSTVRDNGNLGYIFEGGTQVYKKAKNIGYTISRATGYPEFASFTDGYGIRYGDGYDIYFGHVYQGSRVNVGCAGKGDKAYLGQFYNNKLSGVVLEYDKKDYSCSMYDKDKPWGTTIKFYNDSVVIDNTMRGAGTNRDYYYVVHADSFDISKYDRDNKLIETIPYPFKENDKQSLEDVRLVEEEEKLHGKKMALTKAQEDALKDYEYTTFSPDITITGLKKTNGDYINIPGFVTRIEECAFYDKDCKLKDIHTLNLAGSIRDIGKGAFQNMINLNKVSFGVDPKISVIKEDTFRNTSLESIDIPHSVKKIEKNAFGECRLLKYAHVANDCEVSPKAFPAGCKVVREQESKEMLLREIKTKYSPFQKLLYGIKDIFAGKKKTDTSKPTKSTKQSNKSKSKPSVSMPGLDFGFLSNIRPLTWVTLGVVIVLVSYLVYGCSVGMSGISMEFGGVFTNYDWWLFNLVASLTEIDYGFFIGIVMGLVVLVLGLLAIIGDIILYILIGIANILAFIGILLFNLLVGLILPIVGTILLVIRMVMAIRDGNMETIERVINIVLSVIGICVSIAIVLLILA